MRLQENSESVFKSLLCGLRGLKLVLTPGLRRYVLIPVVLNLFLFGGAFWLSESYFAQFLEWLIPGWLDWLRWLLWPVFGFSFLLFMMFTFSLVANILGSPFYGRLARKVESRILGVEGEGLEEPSWLAQLTSEIRRLIFFLSRAIPLLILFVIPGVNLVAPFLWFCFSAWFLGMEYMAYPLEEGGMTFLVQRHLMSPYRFNVTVFGGLALLGLSVPIFNLLVPPAAVIGATLYVHDKKPSRTGFPTPSQ